MEEINTKLAQETYKSLLKAIELNGWVCAKNDEKLSIAFGVNGDDLHMDFLVGIDAQRQLVRLMSKLPFKVPMDKLMDLSIATNAANYSMNDGNFDLDIAGGNVYFRMTTSYRSSIISPNALVYMVNCATWSVDKFNDKLLMVINGKMSTSEFIDFCKN